MRLDGFHDGVDASESETVRRVADEERIFLGTKLFTAKKKRMHRKYTLFRCFANSRKEIN